MGSGSVHIGGQNNPVANAIAHGSETLAEAKGVSCAK
jgi:hypothetical protein